MSASYDRTWSTAGRAWAVGKVAADLDSPPAGAHPGEVYAHLVTGETLTCSSCPLQYEGIVAGVARFYFRARGSRAQLGLGQTSDLAVEATMGRGAGLGYAEERIEPFSLEDDREAYEAMFVRLLRRIVSRELR